MTIDDDPSPTRTELAVQGFIRIVCALLLGFFASASLYWKWHWVWSLRIVGVLDLYLVSILVLSAIRSDVDARVEGIVKKPWKRSHWLFPTRFAGLFVLAFIFVGIVTGFARIHMAHSCDFSPSIGKGWDALYASLMVLGFGGPTPQTDFARRSVIGELISGILFLAGAFPLLIGRLSSFKDTGVKKSEPRPRVWTVDGTVDIHPAKAPGSKAIESLELRGTATLSAVEGEVRVHVTATATLPQPSSTPATVPPKKDAVAPDNQARHND